MDLNGASMNGWGRVGLVLSIIWTAVVLGYVYLEIKSFPLDANTAYLSEPSSFTRKEAEVFFFIYIQASQRKSPAELALYKKYIEEAETEESRQEWISLRDSYRYSSAINAQLILLAIVGPVVFVWLCVQTGLWVLQGFRNEINK